MFLENVGTHSLEDLARQLREMEDNQLQAQEIAQKAAIHAITHLLRHGPSEERARAMLRSMNAFAQIISAECQRRNIATVDHPAGH